MSNFQVPRRRYRDRTSMQARDDGGARPGRHLGPILRWTGGGTQTANQLNWFPYMGGSSKPRLGERGPAGTGEAGKRIPLACRSTLHLSTAFGRDERWCSPSVPEVSQGHEHMHDIRG